MTYQDNYENKAKRAKRWGLAHGYTGSGGGWIYREGRRRPVVQGWFGLFTKHSHAIESWEAAQAGTNPPLGPSNQL